MTKLYVGNLPYTTTNDDLTNMFAPFGAVASANIVMDRFSGKSKGFGFVELEDDAAATKAIEQLNNTDMGGRNIIVSVARPKEERPFQRGGGGFQNRDRDNRGGGGYGRRDDRPRR